MKQIMKVEGLCKTYPAFSLRNVSFSLEEGKITGFIGRNGAGKTTTLKSILGLVHPDKGEIQIFGQEFKENELSIKQQIGYVSGGVSFYPNKKIKTISEVTRGFYKEWDDTRYQECMKRFQLDENKTPAQLSEGMKVKYALALALSHKAKLLILDEPTSGIDPISRDELLDIFMDFQNQGTTILFSTHITSDLDKCADNMIYIQNGEILAESSMKQFVEKYRAVHLTQDQYEAVDHSLLIGCKRSKEGYTALIHAQMEEKVKVTVKAADLETIMVHLEKEGNE